MTPSSDPDQGPGLRRPGLPLGPALINRSVLHHLPLLSSTPMIPGICRDVKGRERLASGATTLVEARRQQRSGGTPAPRGGTMESGAPGPQGGPQEPETSSTLRAAIEDLRSLLVEGERLEAWAVQRRLFALTRRRILVGATTGRLIVLSRHLIGGFAPQDLR